MGSLVDAVAKRRSSGYWKNEFHGYGTVVRTCGCGSGGMNPRPYMGNTYSTYLEEDPNTSKCIVYLSVFGTCIMFTYVLYLQCIWSGAGYIVYICHLPYAHTCHELTVDFAPSVSSRQVFGAPPICSHHNEIARFPPSPPLNLIPVAAVQFHELVSLYAHVSSRQVCSRPAVSSWQV